MGDKVLRLKKHVGSKARIIYPYTITNTGFSDIGLYKRFPYHKTFLEPFVGGWSVVLNHPCWEQSKWNTRTLPVIAVNDLDKGIIDLAWCLLYIPYHFKMTVKNAIHCEGLWEETKDKDLLDRFRSSLRKYYDIEANYHGHPDFANGLSNYYRNEVSYGGKNSSVAMRSNYNRIIIPNEIKDVPAEEIEDGLRKHYLSNHSYDSGGKSFRIHKNQEHDRCARKDPQFGTLRGDSLNNPEDGLRRYYKSQTTYNDLPTAHRSIKGQINKNRGCNFHDHDVSNPEDGLRKQYKERHSYSSRGLSFGNTVNILRMQNDTKPLDYYDEIHTRLRWTQIFNKTYARFFKRFVGWKKGLPKMENGFIYLDPPYFKTIKGKHYEHNMTLEEHHELASWLYEADHQGVKFLLSYDVDERAEDLYSSFKFEKIQVPYSVARSYGDGRAQMDEEYLIMNYNYKQDNYYDQVDLTRKPKLDAFL